MQIGLFMAQHSFKLLGNQSRVQRFSAMSFSETPCRGFGTVFWGEDLGPLTCWIEPPL